MKWRLDSAPSLEIRGRYWRMLAPRWSHSPLSGDGAARAGGRWNQAGQPALYLSDTHATAIAEYQQDLPRPGTLTAYDVTGSGILDLADPTIRTALGVDTGFLRLPWKQFRDVEKTRPPSWDFAAAAQEAGLHGVRVPSVQNTGFNLVFWHWNQPGAPTLRAIDPLGDLPTRPSLIPTALDPRSSRQAVLF